jgi:hypothetical protein
MTDVTSHVPPLVARLYINSSLAPERAAGKTIWRAESTERLPTMNLFGALRVSNASTTSSCAAVSRAPQVLQSCARDGGGKLGCHPVHAAPGHLCLEGEAPGREVDTRY